MEVKAGYKQTEIGVFPVDWQIVETEKITDPSSPICYGVVQVGKNIPTGVPIVAIKYVKEILKANLHRTSQKLEQPYSRSRVFGGEVLISIKGTIGRVGIVPTSFNGNISRELARLKFKAGTYPPFIAHQLEWPVTQSRIMGAVVGTTRLELSIAQLRQFKLAVPPFPEQQAIANALSDADALIESLEQLIEKKRQIKQGVMQELLTGKRRLPGFSGEWERKSFGELFKIGGGLSASRDQLGRKGICYLHYGDIHTTTKNNIELPKEVNNIPKLPISLADVASHFILNDGDIVFVDASEDIDGTSKHVVVDNPENIPFISGLHTIVAKPKCSFLDTRFSRYAFKTKDVQNQFSFYAVGTKVSGVSKSNILKITVKLPPKNEQKAIATILCDVDDQLIDLNEKVTKAKLVKQAMMQELLTGKVRLV